MRLLNISIPVFPRLSSIRWITFIPLLLGWLLLGQTASSQTADTQEIPLSFVNALEFPPIVRPPVAVVEDESNTPIVPSEAETKAETPAFRLMTLPITNPLSGKEFETFLNSHYQRQPFTLWAWNPQAESWSVWTGKPLLNSYPTLTQLEPQAGYFIEGVENFSFWKAPHSPSTLSKFEPPDKAGWNLIGYNLAKTTTPEALFSAALQEKILTVWKYEEVQFKGAFPDVLPGKRFAWTVWSPQASNAQLNALLRELARYEGRNDFASHPPLTKINPGDGLWLQMPEDSPPPLVVRSQLLSDLLKGADLIVQGQVKELTYAKHGPQNTPYTILTLQVEELFQGEMPETSRQNQQIKVAYWGGLNLETGERISSTSCAYSFFEGYRYLFFLKDNTLSPCPFMPYGIYALYLYQGEDALFDLHGFPLEAFSLRGIQWGMRQNALFLARNAEGFKGRKKFSLKDNPFKKFCDCDAPTYSYRQLAQAQKGAAGKKGRITRSDILQAAPAPASIGMTLKQFKKALRQLLSKPEVLKSALEAKPFRNYEGQIQVFSPPAVPASTPTP